MSALYNLRINGPDWTITKFDDDLNVESSYRILQGGATCECPAGFRPSCRHRQMLPELMTRVDTPWFYCFDTGEWEDPTGQAAEQEQEQREATDEFYKTIGVAPEGSRFVGEVNGVPVFETDKIEIASQPRPTIPEEGFAPIKRRL